jgi:hypothetical protein
LVGRYHGEFCATGPQDGIRAQSAIVVNSNPPPPTGLISIHDCTFTDFIWPIVTRGTNNSDNSFVWHNVFFNCDTMFRSENPQTCAWTFRDNVVGCWGRHATILADLVRGGDVVIDGLSLNGPQCTLFRVNEYSPNTSVLKAVNVRWDQGVPDKANYLLPFEYAGDNNDLANKKWQARIEVWPNNQNVTPTGTVLPIKARGVPVSGIKVEVLRTK